MKRPYRFNANHDEYFQLWALRFELLADAKYCMDVIRQDLVEDLEIEEIDENVHKKVVRARALLVICLGCKALRTVASDQKNPLHMYKKLTNRYTTKTPESRLQLQTQLYQIRFDGSKAMIE